MRDKFESLPPAGKIGVIAGGAFFALILIGQIAKAVS